MIRLVPRIERSSRFVLVAPLIAFALTILTGFVLFSLLGRDPIEALELMFIAPLRSWFSVGELIVKATPLILIALGLSFGFRAGVWNIGAEGQYIMGALASGSFALAVYPLGGWWLLPMMCICGILAGMAWAFIPAVLRIRFRTNEILVSLMLSYVAILFLSAMVAGPLRDPDGINMPESRLLQSSAQLPLLFDGMRAHVGIIIALILAAILWLLAGRHLFGYQIKLFGQAPDAARFAGFTEKGVVVATMLLSGALAGLAGTIDLAGPVGQLSDRVSVGYGFTAIIVAFLGQLHPAGVVIAGFVMAITYVGGELVQLNLGLSASIISVFQGILLLNLLAVQFLADCRLQWTLNLTSRAATKAVQPASRPAPSKE